MNYNEKIAYYQASDLYPNQIKSLRLEPSLPKNYFSYSKFAYRLLGSNLYLIGNGDNWEWVSQKMCGYKKRHHRKRKYTPVYKYKKISFSELFPQLKDNHSELLYHLDFLSKT